MALNFGHSKKWADITLNELDYFAGKAGLPLALVRPVAKSTVQKFQEAWVHEKNNLLLTQHAISVIDRQLNSVPLVKEVS